MTTDALASEKDEDVGRLTDMDTREVSVVDRAANKKVFLIIKRDGDVTTTTETKKPKTEPETGAVKKQLEDGLTRVDAIKAAIEATETAKEGGGSVPEAVKTEIVVTQCVLKGIAGVTVKGSLVMAQADLSGIGPITQVAKTAAVKILDEVSTRVSTLKDAIGTATMLDAVQARSLDGAADLLASIPSMGAAGPFVTKASLTGAQADKVFVAIQKSVAELTSLFVALQTDTVAKSADVADQFVVGSVLHAAASEVEKSVAEILSGGEDHRSAGERAVESIREIEKSLGDKASEALTEVSGTVVEIAKAATMYETACDWDAKPGEDKYYVVLRTAPEPDKKISSHGSRIEAKNAALKLNMEAVAKIAKGATKKGFTVKPGGKGYLVVDADSGKIVLDTADEAAAKKKAMELNFGAKKNDTGKEDDVTATATATTGTETTQTGKVGTPMQSNRLNRLKGAVKLLKEALGDLRSGSVSMEKFRKVGDLLGTLINELGVVKQSGQTGGVDDVRDTTPGNANVGSGVQPDAASVADATAVVGDGTPDSLKQILKQLEDLKGEVAKVSEAATKKDETIAGLKTELATIKKAKAAPSAPPEDDGVVAGKVEKSERVAWPADMNTITLKD